MKRHHLLLWSALVTTGAIATPALAAPQFEKGAVVTAADPAAPVEFEVYLPLRNKAALDG
jgi:hypothetical protein